LTTKKTHTENIRCFAVKGRDNLRDADKKEGRTAMRSLKVRSVDKKQEKMTKKLQDVLLLQEKYKNKR
jgi:hypothetical protein